MLEELDAARHGICNMPNLCGHQVGTLLTIGREFDDLGIKEQVCKIQSFNDKTMLASRR